MTGHLCPSMECAMNNHRMPVPVISGGAYGIPQALPASDAHPCVWLVLAVQPGVAFETHALMRCGFCGSVRTETLKGSWTLAQVRAEATCGRAHPEARLALLLDHARDDTGGPP
jgi:hypothetical protein